MRRDTAAGLTFLAFSLFFLIFGMELPMGTARRVGPGVLPVGAAALLLVLAVAILVQDYLRRSGRRIGGFNWRGLAAITASVLIFALAVHPLGMVVTVNLSVLVAGAAEKPFRALESLLLGAGLSIAAVGVFIYGIGMRIPVWPNF